MAKLVETVFAMAETPISRMNERLVPTPRAGPLNVSFVGGPCRAFYRNWSAAIDQEPPVQASRASGRFLRNRTFALHSCELASRPRL